MSPRSDHAHPHTSQPRSPPSELTARKTEADTGPNVLYREAEPAALEPLRDRAARRLDVVDAHARPVVAAVHHDRFPASEYQQRLGDLLDALTAPPHTAAKTATDTLFIARMRLPRPGQ